LIFLPSFFPLPVHFLLWLLIRFRSRFKLARGVLHSLFTRLAVFSPPPRRCFSSTAFLSMDHTRRRFLHHALGDGLWSFSPKDILLLLSYLLFAMCRVVSHPSPFLNSPPPLFLFPLPTFVGGRPFSPSIQGLNESHSFLPSTSFSYYY